MFKKLFVSIPLLLSAAQDELDITKLSEAVGHMIGRNLEDLGLEFDLDAIVKGLREESEGISSPMNEDECVQAIVSLQEEKIENISQQNLDKANAMSNGELIQEHEDHSIPATDSAKYR